MSGVNSLPVVSQAKSAVQALAGDMEAARETQIDFLDMCPLVSQGTSFYHWCQNDNDAAKRTQIKFVHGVSNFVDGFPAVGHVKGGVHYACGDKEGGDRAMKAASRRTGVIGGGFVGGIVGGPVGGIAGGIAGGVAVDGMTTGIESAVHKEYRPAGHVATATNILKGEANVGEVFDAAAGVGFDGLAGYGAGKAGLRFRNRKNTQLYRVAREQEVQNTIKTGKLKDLPGPHSEYWVSETLEHTEGYYKTRTCSDKAILKMDVPKEFVNEIKAKAVNQRGSRATIPSDGKVPNVINTERISQPGKVNIGFKGELNLRNLNEHITSVERVNPGKISAQLPSKVGEYGVSAGIVVKDDEDNKIGRLKCKL